jgi:O-antigen/teichoic acid export membrane protein
MAASTWPGQQPGAATVRANLLAVGVSEAVARAAQLVTLGLLARALGQEGMGVVGTAWAVFQLAVPFVQYAPELIGTREVARGVDAPGTFAQVILVKLAIAFLAALPIVGGALLLLADDRQSELQVILQIPVLLVTALGGVWVFRGQSQLWVYAAIRIAAAASLLAILFVMLQAAESPWVVPVAETATGLIAALIALVMIGWRVALPKLAQAVRGWRAGLGKQIYEAIQFGLGTFFAAAMWSTPMLVSRLYLDPGEQGLLAAAIRLFLAVSALFQLGLQVFHPVLAHRYSQDREAAKRLVAALVVLVFAASVPVALALAGLAPYIVRPMLGAEFDRAADVLATLAPTLIPTAVSSVFGYALLADGRYRIYVAICAAGAAASAVGSLVAFTILPDPEAAILLTPVMAASAIGQILAVWRLDLISIRHVTWRQLAPRRVWQMLKER